GRWRRNRMFLPRIKGRMKESKSYGELQSMVPTIQLDQRFCPADPNKPESIFDEACRIARNYAAELQAANEAREQMIASEQKLVDRLIATERLNTTLRMKILEAVRDLDNGAPGLARLNLLEALRVK